jgi:hypothetical protein
VRVESQRQQDLLRRVKLRAEKIAAVELQGGIVAGFGEEKKTMRGG